MQLGFAAQAGGADHRARRHVFEAGVLARDKGVQGHFARHVKKMRTLYARRRDQLVQALTVLEPDGLFVERRQGGMHLVIRSTRAEADTAFARRLQAAGLAVQALSTWSADGRGPQGLLAGFANVETTTQAKQIAARMCQSMGSLCLPDQTG